MTDKPKLDSVKFKELVLYVANKCAQQRLFGATKLNKILFFSDFLAYGILGKPVTGATYQRLKNGPAPRPLLPLSAELIKEGDAVLVPVQVFNFSQKRLVPKRESDVTVFSAEELKLIDDVIAALCDYTADDVSDLSHKRSAGWNLVNEGEDIPYYSVFLSTSPLTQVDIEKGQQIAAKYGWKSTDASAT